MSMKPTYSDDFLAKQVAGSCKLSGISVSEADERQIRDIISGKVDAGEARNRLVEKFKNQNKD